MLAITSNPVDIALAVVLGVPCLIAAVSYLATWASGIPVCRHCGIPSLFARMGSWCPESDPDDLDLHDFTEVTR